MTLGTEDTSALAALAMSDPPRARRLADEQLRSDPPPEPMERARLHWIAGRSARDDGDLEAARRHLDAALADARTADCRELVLAASSSLAYLLGLQGDLDGADRAIDSVESMAHLVERPRLRAQRGLIAYLRGDLHRAAEVMTATCEELARLDDHVHEARHRANLGIVLSDLGRYGAAREELQRAIGRAEELGLTSLLIVAEATLGYVMMLQGDLPDALEQFNRADQRRRDEASGTYVPQLHANHARVLGEMALYDEAAILLERAVGLLRDRGQYTELPGVLLRCAEVGLASGDLGGAAASAREAADLFRAQGRERWVALATSLTLQAEARIDGASVELAAQLDESAKNLEACGWSTEAVRARLVASKIRVDAGATGTVVDRLTRFAVRNGRPADGALLAYIDAAAAHRRKDHQNARRSITRGLRLAMATQAGLGSIESRAHASVHGFELTQLGARMAVADRRPRELLSRIEATRILTSRMPALRPPDDDAVAGMLTELRTLQLRVADTTTSTEDRQRCEQDQREIERQIRRRRSGRRGEAVQPGEVGPAIAMALDTLGERVLLAHAAVDGVLHAVSIIRGRARLHELGSLDAVAGHLDAVTFSLARLNRRQGSEPARAAASTLLVTATDLLSRLLVPDELARSDRSVVVVPTALLHDVPWNLLPRLAGRPISVNRSVTGWARAENRRLDRVAVHGGDRQVGLVAGPGLAHAHEEIRSVERLHRQATTLVESAATVSACLALARSSDVLHIACHGSFRTDNPLFSSLQLTDGPLVVYDFEQLSRQPELLVLSACSAATSHVLHGGSLLGLAAALTTLGACSVIAPLTPISDAAAVPVMRRLHARLAQGAAPAVALAATVGEVAHDDPVAGSFVAMGA